MRFVSISPDQAILDGEATTVEIELENYQTGSWQVLEGPSLNDSQFTDRFSTTTLFAPQGGPGRYQLAWLPGPNACNSIAVYIERLNGCL